VGKVVAAVVAELPPAAAIPRSVGYVGGVYGATNLVMRAAGPHLFV
jgi:hypothetical protein